MFEAILKSIQKNQKTCYFVSPHFDDAVLSAGALMVYLSSFTKIVIINVFTKPDNSVNTLSAKTFVKQCGYKNAEQLYNDRVNEDAFVFKRIAEKIFNLGFTDALWRKKYTKGVLSRFFGFIPEFQVIYPTYKFHIIKGMIAKQDMQTLELIKVKLQELIDYNNSVVFCPFGIGNHIDHVITRRACDEVFSAPIYWSDFPYNVSSHKNIDELRFYSFEKKLSNKHELIKGYKTQYKALFGDNFVIKPEVFLMKK